MLYRKYRILLVSHALDRVVKEVSVRYMSDLSDIFWYVVVVILRGYFYGFGL